MILNNCDISFSGIFSLDIVHYHERYFIHKVIQKDCDNWIEIGLIGDIHCITAGSLSRLLTLWQAEQLNEEIIVALESNSTETPKMFVDV